MLNAKRWLVTLFLMYAGIPVPLPAPEDWQTFRETGFTLHLPQGWQELEKNELVKLPKELGARPDHAFRHGSSYVTVHVGKGGKEFMGGADGLAAKEEALRRDIESSLHRIDPEMAYRLELRPVFDPARQRVWWRLLTQLSPQDPVHRIFVAIILTNKGALRVSALARAEDYFDDTFNGLVTSIELDRDLQYRAQRVQFDEIPAGIFRIAKGTVLRPAEKAFLFGSTAVLLLISLGSLGLILSIALDVVLLKGRIKSSVISRLQKTPLFRMRRQPAEPRFSLRRLPLRWSFAWQIVLSFTVGLLLAPLYLHNPDLYSGIFRASFYAAGYALLALAVGFHYVPDSRRLVKYELLAAAFSTMAVPGALEDPWSQASIVGQNPAFVDGYYLGNFGSQALYFGLAGIPVFLLLRSGGPVAERRAAFLYRITHRFAKLPMGLVAFAPLIPAGVLFSAGYAFLVARYLIGEKALENPLLYLRSYHDRNTARSLGKIVMPAAGRFGPILATAHALQPPHELYRKTNLVTAAKLTLLSDADWQEWILAALPRCRAVIIDVSVASEGLLWEIEQIRHALPSERIVVLMNEEAPADAIMIPGVHVIRYRLGWRGQWAARKALRRWLKTLRTAPPRSLGRDMTA